jgi:hypothetical protein
VAVGAAEPKFEPVTVTVGAASVPLSVTLEMLGGGGSCQEQLLRSPREDDVGRSRRVGVDDEDGVVVGIPAAVGEGESCLPGP